MSNHYFTPDFSNEVCEEVTECCSCESRIEVGQNMVQKSQKVGIFSGNYMIEHDYEYADFCVECGESAQSPEEYDDSVDETNYDPYAGCDSYDYNDGYGDEY